jgi:N-acyl-D-aspartate/D-glutamate deacylase
VAIERTMALVSFGALSLLDAATKLSYTPSRMLGLLNKGHLSDGADGDVTVIDRLTGKAAMSLVNGRPIMITGRVVGSGGTWLVTGKGEKTAQASGVPYEVMDLEKSKLYRNWK